MDIERIVKIIFIVFAVIIFIAALFCKKPLKMLFLNSFLSILVLVIINLTSNFTGVYLPINQYTVSGCAVSGIPGVVMFLFFKLIFL